MNIMIVGVGGQGTLLTSKIIGNTALCGGYAVKISEVHGMAQRGGSVVTFVRYGARVDECVVEEGQADFLIAFEKLEALRYAHFLKKDGVLVMNDCEINPITVTIGAANYPQNILEDLKKEHTVYEINGEEIAREIGNSKVLNSVVLGLFARYGEFSKDEWLRVLKETVPQKTIEKNILAFEAGYNKGM